MHFKDRCLKILQDFPDTFLAMLPLTSMEKWLFQNFIKCSSTIVAETREIETSCEMHQLFEPRHEKTNILVSDLVQHKPGCTATEDG